MGYLKEVTITHAPGGPAPRTHDDTEMHFLRFHLGVVAKEPPTQRTQTTRRYIEADLGFAKKEKAASDNNSTT